MNAIADTVQGKEYDSPPYTVVATYEDGSNSVRIQQYITHMMNHRATLKMETHAINKFKISLLFSHFSCKKIALLLRF